LRQPLLPRLVAEVRRIVAELTAAHGKAKGLRPKTRPEPEPERPKQNCCSLRQRRVCGRGSVQNADGNLVLHPEGRRVRGRVAECRQLRVGAPVTITWHAGTRGAPSGIQHVSFPRVHASEHPHRGEQLGCRSWRCALLRLLNLKSRFVFCAILILYEVSKVCRACQMLARGGLDLARPGNTVEGGGAVAGGKVDVRTKAVVPAATCHSHP